MCWKAGWGESSSKANCIPIIAEYASTTPLDTLTFPSFSHLLTHCFFYCFAATQISRQVQQERTASQTFFFFESTQLVHRVQPKRTQMEVQYKARETLQCLARRHSRIYYYFYVCFYDCCFKVHIRIRRCTNKQWIEENTLTQCQIGYEL